MELDFTHISALSASKMLFLSKEHWRDTVELGISFLIPVCFLLVSGAYRCEGTPSNSHPTVSFSGTLMAGYSEIFPAPQQAAS